MHPPLLKHFQLVTKAEDILSDYSKHTQIPIGTHPGAFGAVRKHHQHEGIDLYGNEGDAVYAICKGKVVYVGVFTGEPAGTPWWETTYCVLVANENVVINYGEISEPNLKVGDTLEEGDLIGHLKTVLRKDKGRPMTMLHLESYTQGTDKPIPIWDLGQPKPGVLLNPTQLVLPFVL